MKQIIEVDFEDEHSKRSCALKKSCYLVSKKGTEIFLT